MCVRTCICQSRVDGTVCVYVCTCKYACTVDPFLYLRHMKRSGRELAGFWFGRVAVAVAK